MADKAPQPLKEKAAWTVMVYLAGDNNLTDECIYAMTEMRKVGSGDGVNIITQFDPKDDYLPTHRYHIGRNGNHRPLPDDIIDQAKTNKFKNESDRAKRHAEARDKAREAAEKAVAEAEKAVEATRAKEEVRAAEPANQGGVQAVEPVVKTTLFEVLADAEISENETDTGSPITLYNFMSLCIQKFPAHHYMVVLSGHGQGNVRDFLLKDDSPVGSLTINELKNAFKELEPELNGQVIDILGMDVCLMSMAEVAYEMRGLVKIMVSAESYSPASGWPYEPILRVLKEQSAKVVQAEEASLPKLDRIEYRFAKEVVKEYVNFYTDYWLGGLSVDQAALDVGEVGRLKDLINALADELTYEINKEVEEEEKALALPENEGKLIERRNFRDVLILAHWETQSYNGELFVDILDFCNCLLKRLQSGPVVEKGSELRDFIQNTFVLRSCYSGPVFQYSYGVSIYFPWAIIDHDYRNLDFVKGSTKKGWAAFLEAYTTKTRRLPRKVEQHLGKEDWLRLDKVTPNRFRVSQGKGPDNPVRSMRNPPVVAFPEDDCIIAADSIRKGTKFLLGI